MPGFLQHLGAQVQCLHAGKATPAAVNPRVQVSGQSTVLVSTPHVVAGCTLPPPSAANGPCVSAQWLTGTGTTRVTSNGQPLLVQSSQATCAPTGTPLQVVTTQTRASAL
jgi:hypothetical protein